MFNNANETSSVDARQQDDDDELVELLAAYQYMRRKNIRMAAELATRLGIGPTDLRLLLHINGRSNVTAKEAAAILDQVTGSTTALMDRLERRGYLERRPHPTDRRSLTLSLTPLGHDAVEAVREAYAEAFSEAFSADEFGKVAAILRALGEALGSEETALDAEGR